MEKRINCTKCHRSIKIAGPSQGQGKEVSQGVTCPYCEEPNEVMWPMAAGYIVTPDE